MSKGIEAVRGMNDILPEDTPLWLWCEAQCRAVFSLYGYAQIRLPIVEKTALYKRSIGEVTDIIEKEMYTFEDRNGDLLSLRPEGTAGCVRAGIQRGLLYNQTQRLWYAGPMFRHERPQKGRYRQFHQWGVEAFGFAGPEIDVELLAMAARLWRSLGLANCIKLQINSLGQPLERKQFREALQGYLQAHEAQLDADSQRRLHTNPLRVLDSKDPATQAILRDAPALSDYTSDASHAHLEAVCAGLKALGIPYTLNSHLVRGLDYYNDTVFEWVTDELGAQGTVCAGGRYDALVAQLGGRAAPAVGMAMGLERLVCLLASRQTRPQPKAIAVVVLDGMPWASAWPRIEALRDACPQQRVIAMVKGGSLKSQLKRADQAQAAYAVLMGLPDATPEEVGLKNLQTGEQQQMLFSACLPLLQAEA